MKNLIVDYRIDEIEKETLQRLGFNTIMCPYCNKLYKAVCGHPDMLLHFINSKTVIVHRDMDLDFINLLKKLNLKVILSKNSLTSKYPNDIMLNAVNLPLYFIHSINYTDKILFENIKHKKIINVKQGYTKCSTAIVTDSAIMTSDLSIAKKLHLEGFDVLLLPPSDIILPGLNYGFIGGTCGLIDKNLLAFYGDLKNYAFGNDVLNFLKKHKVDPVFLRKGKLIDRGSILQIN